MNNVIVNILIIIFLFCILFRKILSKQFSVFIKKIYTIYSTINQTWRKIFIIFTLLTLLSFLAVFITGECTLAQNISVSIFSGFFVLLIATIFITFYIGQTEEKRRINNELNAILRYHKIIKVYIDDYVSAYSKCISLQNLPDENVVLSSNFFQFEKLQNIYYPCVDIKYKLFKKRIELFFEKERNLKQMIISSIENLDFEYYKNICTIFINFISISSEFDVAENILAAQDTKIGDKLLSDMATKKLKNFHGTFEDAQNEFKEPLYAPYLVLYGLMINEAAILNEYLTAIEELKKNNC